MLHIKKLTGKIHLWLGLVVFIVSLTGCLIVFGKEISILFQVGVFRGPKQRRTTLTDELLHPCRQHRRVDRQGAGFFCKPDRRFLACDGIYDLAGEEEKKIILDGRINFSFFCRSFIT